MATDSTDPLQEYDGIPDRPGPDHRATTTPAWWLTAARRRWLYLVLTAAVPLLIIYGVLDEETAPLWVALAAAVLGTATAAANTPPTN